MEKIKIFWARNKKDIVAVLIVVLVALLAFGLGRLSVLYSGEGELKIEYPAAQGAAAVLSQEAGFVASKTGSKYHLPWCAGAQAIKPENKIYFATKEEAEARGYTPATNCRGL